MLSLKPKVKYAKLQRKPKDTNKPMESVMSACTSQLCGPDSEIAVTNSVTCVWKVSIWISNVHSLIHSSQITSPWEWSARLAAPTFQGKHSTFLSVMTWTFMRSVQKNMSATVWPCSKWVRIKEKVHDLLNDFIWIHLIQNLAQLAHKSNRSDVPQEQHARNTTGFMRYGLTITHDQTW